jgi:hypothetical protein
VSRPAMRARPVLGLGLLLVAIAAYVFYSPAPDAGVSNKSQEPRQVGHPVLQGTRESGLEPTPAGAPSPHPALPHLCSVTVNNLRTMRPLASVVLPIPSPRVDLPTDAQAMLTVETRQLESMVREAGATYYFEDPAPAARLESGRLVWAVPKLRLEIACSDEAGVPLSSGTEVQVTVTRPFQEFLAPGDELSRSVHASAEIDLLRRLGLSRTLMVATCGPHGVVRIEVPSGPSLGLSVLQADRCGGYLEVPMPTERWLEPQLVTMATSLRRSGFVARGVLLDEAGRPIQNQRVSVLVGRTLDATKVNVSEELARGGAVGMSIMGGGRAAYVKSHVSGRTATDGTFAIASPTQGEGAVVVFRVGYLPYRRTLSVEEAASGIEMRLVATPGPRFFVARWNRKALAGGSIHVSDMSRRPQLWFDVGVDGEGRCACEWFEPNIEYSLTYVPGAGMDVPLGLTCRVTWEGQGALDFGENR